MVVVIFRYLLDNFLLLVLRQIIRSSHLEYTIIFSMIISVENPRNPVRRGVNTYYSSLYNIGWFLLWIRVDHEFDHCVHQGISRETNGNVERLASK